VVDICIAWSRRQLELWISLSNNDNITVVDEDDDGGDFRSRNGILVEFEERKIGDSEGMAMVVVDA
jgi:hypothetical protein